MAEKNNDNRSLILYTSLIFLVAIVVIAVATLGGAHLDQARISEQEAERVSLSNKAAQVSEENMQLVEFNKNLRHNNQVLLDEKNALTTERDGLLKTVAGYEALISVYDKLAADDKEGAKTLLQGIFTEDLSDKQKEIYDSLVKKTEIAEKQQVK